jgi:hypothetical protein
MNEIAALGVGALVGLAIAVVVGNRHLGFVSLGILFVIYLVARLMHPVGADVSLAHDKTDSRRTTHG